MKELQVLEHSARILVRDIGSGWPYECLIGDPASQRKDEAAFEYRQFDDLQCDAVLGSGVRAASFRPESMWDSHGRADLIHGAGWMEVGMDGQAVIDGSAVAGAGRG